MFAINWKTTAFCILFSSSAANAAVVKAIDFEAETVGTAPSTSTTDNSKIDQVRFGTPTIEQEANNNKYLYFDYNGTYDQIYVDTFSDINTQTFSFDMFISDSATDSNSAVLFFDTPTIQRYDFFEDGRITVENVDADSRINGSSPVQYSNIYTADHDVSNSYDLTQWHNYLFEIDYANQLVELYIDSVKVFTDSIFLQYGGGTNNTIRFSTGNNFGIDNINLTGIASNSNTIDEPSTLLLLSLSLLGMSYYRKKAAK